VKITRMGHASVLVETTSTRILVDPGAFSTEWHGLSDLDVIVVTHEHRDHFDADNLASLIKTNPASQFMGPGSVIGQMDGLGTSAVELNPGQALAFGSTEVEVVGGTHAVLHPSIPRVPNLGLIFSESDGPRLFHPGDSFETAPEAIDCLAFPLNAPWSTVAATAEFINAVSPQMAMPIHDTFLSPAGHATFLGIVRRLVDAAPEIIDVESDGNLAL
jgi:L-ascorbate metabolism protein UlaG (beta-lactamase superfamily)